MPKKLRFLTSTGMGMPRRWGILERKSHWTCSLAVGPKVCRLCLRDEGREETCARGRGRGVEDCRLLICGGLAAPSVRAIRSHRGRKEEKGEERNR